MLFVFSLSHSTIPLSLIILRICRTYVFFEAAQDHSINNKGTLKILLHAWGNIKKNITHTSYGSTHTDTHTQENWPPHEWIKGFELVSHTLLWCCFFYFFSLVRTPLYTHKTQYNQILKYNIFENYRLSVPKVYNISAFSQIK